MVSFVWDHFDRNEDETSATCRLCGSAIFSKGSTSTLIRHLKKMHSIDKPDLDEEEPQRKKMKQSTLQFQTKSKISANEAFAELICKDGFTVNQVQKSRFVRKGLASENIDVPKSNNTIMKKVHEFYSEKRTSLISTLKKEKLLGMKWSISFDEWTSKRGRRYLNINLHGNERIDCLGMVRVFGSLTSARTEELIRDKLNEFELEMDMDIVAIIGDGAAVNIKFMKSSKLEYQVCMDHGIHLGVCDALYKRIPNPNADLLLDSLSEQNDDDDSGSCSSEESFSEIESDIEAVNDDDPLLNSNLHLSVVAVRKIVIMFKKSDLNNQYLQEEVVEIFGHEIHLTLDVKTR